MSRPANRRCTSCALCHKRKVSCDGGLPTCGSCKKYNGPLKVKGEELVCEYPLPAAEMLARRTSAEDSKTIQAGAIEELGMQRRRTRSATALEGSLDNKKEIAAASVKVEPKPEMEIEHEQPVKPVEGKEEAGEKEKEKQEIEEEPVAPVKVEPVLKEHETRPPSPIQEEPLTASHDLHDTHSILHDMPIYREPMPFVSPDPFAEPVPPVFTADPVISPFISIFGGSTTLFQIPAIRPSSPVLYQLRQGSDSSSSSEEILASPFLHPEPPSAGLPLPEMSSSYDEYIAKLDEGHFAMWTE